MSDKNENISSAEMTAYWRCKYPQLSGDRLSVKLASSEGIQKAKEFEKKFQYPLVGRKISVRAGWFLKQVTNLLLTGKYDSCISLGSGFSLLTYLLALATNEQRPAINFYDVDLDEIIHLRKERIDKLPINTLTPQVIRKTHNIAFDLEKAFQEGKKFGDMFPNCEAPLFIIEGIIYFLSKGCVQWIYNSIVNYRNSAVLFDYWPESGPDNSKCFKAMLESIKNFIPEKVRGLLSQQEIIKLCQSPLFSDVSLKEVENEYSREKGEQPQLVDQNEFIPVRLVIFQNLVK